MSIFVGSGFNLPPVAVAGFDRLISAGDTVLIDGSGSYDKSGDALTYQWDILSQPPLSFSFIADPTAIRFDQNFDVEGTYVLQLSVRDESGQATRDIIVFDTLSSGNLARSGGPILDADGTISGNNASVDGQFSRHGADMLDALSYAWTLPVLPIGEGDFSEPNSASSDVSFDNGGEGFVSDPSALAGLELLSTYNLISFGDLDSQVDTRGRAFVGGDLIGNSATFASELRNSRGETVLEVVGDIRGGNKNINNGGNVVVGGTSQTRLNLNGGGQLIFDPSLSVQPLMSQINSLSDSLATLEANSSVEIPTNRHGPGRLIVESGANNVAVINIEDGNRSVSYTHLTLPTKA